MLKEISFNELEKILRKRYYVCNTKGHQKLTEKEHVLMSEQGKKLETGLAKYCEYCYRFVDYKGVWPYSQESHDFFHGLTKLEKDLQEREIKVIHLTKDKYD